MKIRFYHPPRYGRRIVLMIIGVLIHGLGLSLLINMEMGTDPYSSFVQGVTNFIPVSFGTCSLLCHFVNFLFVIKWDRTYIGWGTIGNMVFLGYVADGFTWLFGQVLGIHFPTEGISMYIFLVISLLILMFGAALYMSAGIGSSPYDAMPFILAEKVKKLPFKYVRMLWDIAFLSVGFLLGGDVGIMTIAVAFGIGPVISRIKLWVTKSFLE